MSPDMSWQDVVQQLELAPHPEGGFYRETFRDVQADSVGRAHSTAIYFLLPEGVISRWHRVDAAEAWHWYGGAPSRLSETDGETGPDVMAARHVTLGNDLRLGEHPQHVIAAHAWQQAQSLGAWTLVGCTVAPGFQFEGFEMAR
ncbi:MAG: putative cupin superfamily sugar epimerase [Hyphomicrobiaceae bacterium]|jgi:predicted cupin superfamily sugar epimerase